MLVLPTRNSLTSVSVHSLKKTNSIGSTRAFYRPHGFRPRSEIRGLLLFSAVLGVVSGKYSISGMYVFCFTLLFCDVFYFVFDRVLYFQ